MDYNAQLPSSPSITEAELQEEMPPEYGPSEFKAGPSTPRELMRPGHWPPDDIASSSLRLRRRAVLKFNGIIPPELPTSSKTFELATSDHHWILLREAIYWAVHEIFKLWVQDTSRKEKIENFDAFWAWVNDQPFRNEYLQKVANIYARYNIQPPPQGVEYVETIELITSRQPLNIDRILAALDPKLIPADLDRDALQNDLQGSLWHYDEAQDRATPGEDRFAALREAHELAQKLITILKSKELQEHIRSSTCESMINSVDEVARECKSPIDALDDEEFNANYVALRAGLLPSDSRYEGWSSFDWLVGEYLPRVFYRHFKCTPTTTPDSLYVRFAESVLMEAKIRNDRGDFYARGSISRQMKYKRGGHRRQKPRK
jgi:hypothetical protein